MISDGFSKTMQHIKSYQHQDIQANVPVLDTLYVVRNGKV